MLKYSTIQNKITTLLILFPFALAFLACEDETPVVQKVSNLDVYVGDWQGEQIVRIKSDASGDTTELTETLRLIADSPSSGRFEIVDTLSAVVNQGSFTVSEVSNADLSLDAAPRILRLIFLVEDEDDAYEQEVNGENVYYDYQTFNIREVSSNALVLTDATSDRDLVIYSYVK